MKSAILVFLGGFLAIEIQAQFFQYYHSFAPPQPYVPFLQPPVIPQPQFFYHQQYHQPATPFRHHQQFQQPFNHHQQFQQTISSPFRREGSQVGGDNYLGYSYRTTHENGASSSVVFFTGQVQNVSTVFKSPAVTVASDSVDPQRSTNVEESIQKEFNNRKGKSSFDSPNPPFNLFPFVSTILGKSEVPFGTFHYYQTDGLPASTALLKPEELPANNITSRFSEEDASQPKVDDSITANATNVTSTESNETESTTIEADFEGEATDEVTTIVNDATDETDEVVSTTEAISTSTTSS